MTTAIVIAALLAYSWVAHYFWRRWAWEFAQDRFNTRGEAVVFGFIQALIWPLVFAWKAATRNEGFLLPPPSVRQQEKERAMQKRIADLERELGIGQKSASANPRGPFGV